MTFIFFITFYISSSFAPKLFILLPKSALFGVLGAKPVEGGKISSSKMFIIQEIASALIAGVIVVMAGFQTLLDFCLRQNRCAIPWSPLHSALRTPLFRYAKSIAPCRMHLQKKVRGVLRGGMRGLAAKAQAPPFAPLHNSASASPQNQLHLAECTCRKKVAWWAAMCYAGLVH